MSPARDGTATLHQAVRSAAAGELPEWARVGEERRAHMARVSALLEGWARAAGLGAAEVTRWSAAGWLHDALRDASPDELRRLAPPEMGDAPGPVLHGPAAAARLRGEGVDDEELLRAVAYHTLGHPRFDDLGMATYCADFLEPGRPFRKEWRAGLRERMPGALEDVTREIVGARIRHLLDEGRAVHPLTVELWNRLAGGNPWARASEV